MSFPIDFGTVKPGTTLYLPFHTFDSNDPSASVTISGLATTDIEVYKDGSTTQRASDAGYALLDTDGIDFDGTTGIHGISVDLADNTTANFYEAGSQYWVVIASITVDAATVNFLAATFRIGYDGAILDTTIATLASQTGFTLEDGSADNDAYNGCIAYVHDLASAVQVAIGVVSDYVGSTKTVTLAADPGIFTMAAGDNISLFPPALLPTTAGRTLDVAATGEAGVDFDNVNGTLDAAEIGTGAITAAKFAAGAIDAAAIGTGAIDADSIATDAITAAKIAADAIGASELATDAIGDAQIATGAIAATAFAAGAIDAAAIGTGAIDADSIATDAITATKIAADAIGASEIAADAIGSSELATTAVNEIRDAILSDSTAFAGANVDAAVSTRATPAEVNTEVLDVMNTDTITLPGQTAPPLAPTHRQAIAWLYKVFRNRKTQTATQWSLTADDESTVDAKATVSDDGTTAIKQEIVSGP